MKKLLTVCSVIMAVSVFSQTKIGLEVGVGFGNRTNIDGYVQRSEGILTIQSEVGTNVALVTQLNLLERFF